MERLIPWLVLAAGVVAYHDCLHNEFVFDDLLYIVENRAIQSGWPPREILTQSTRPVVMLSFAVNHALGGLDPWGYRLLNVGIHLAAALLLYGVVRRSLGKAAKAAAQPAAGERSAGPREAAQGPGWKRAAAWAAGIVAMLWVAHPLQTQSVSYVWQRCESLMGMFYLLTLYCVIRSDASPRALGWSAAAVISCALGMASKEVMVTAPVVVLLYDRAFLAGSWKEVARRRRGLYAGLAGTWLLLPILMARAATRTGIWKATWIAGYENLSPASYLLTQASVILHYLRLAIWPDRLCLDYRSVWPVASSVAEAWPALLAVGGLLLLTAWAWGRRPALGFVGVWFFLILAPTSSLVPLEDLVFEHRMYLPLAAVIALPVIAGVALLDRLRWRRRWLQVGAGALALGLVIVLAAVTAQRNLDYRSSLSIWRDTVAKAPNNPRAHHGLALALEERGRSQEAIAEFQQALRIRPNYSEAHNSLGLALSARGRLEEAMDHFREALRIHPGLAPAHNNLGIALDRRGRFEEAIAHYGEALRIDPLSPDVHGNLGIALERSGRTQEAIAQYREALRSDPDFEPAREGLRRLNAPLD
jgi:tetratricopeptide (TPR) repeat protein